MAVRMTIPRQRRWPALVLAAVVVFVVLVVATSGFIVDLLWYREVDLSDVFWTTLQTKVLLGAAFGIFFFALLYLNLLVVKRLAPETRVVTLEEQVIQRIREQVEPYLRWLVPAGCAILALFVAFSASRNWQTFLLWRNSGGLSFTDSIGQNAAEPQFGKDPAFYVFQLPWLALVQGWLFSALAGVTFIVGVAHVLWGGIRPQARTWTEKVAPSARAHLSVLLGSIMFVKAWGYYLGRFDLLTSERGVVHGASYTDVNAQLPALTFLAIVAVICGLLFFANIRVRLWSLPVIAVGLLALVSVLLGTAYPAFVQQFSVKPQEFQREQPFIERNIEGTRRAFNLTAIDQRPVDVQGSVSKEQVDANRVTIDNIRLWRPTILQDNLRVSQRIRQYYDFRDVDVDRYTVGGERRLLMVSGREVNQSQIPGTGGTWQNRHLVYTHGVGAVAAVVNTATPEGAPELLLQDIPPVLDAEAVGSSDLEASLYRIYYGEQADTPFVITGSGTSELNDDPSESGYAYDGTGGIPIGGFFQRLIWAAKFRDVNLLISGQVRSDSRILIYRDIEDRVKKAVPFLKFDHDPYLAIVDDRLVWIWDAYTLTDAYPYAQSVDLGDATGDDAFTGSANYMRNSVKTVVDAYNGTITYYADIPSDPIIAAWDRAFPGMFTPIEEASTDLTAHFRYPEALLQVQAAQFANYHVDDPGVFYRKEAAWAVPADPTLEEQSASGTVSTMLLRPNYQLIRLPGDTEEGFHLVIPFTPEGRPENMVSYMAASSDPETYGEVVAFTFPAGRNVDAPARVFSRINADPIFSADRSLLSQEGSTVVFGDLLVIPIEDSVLYALPVYVRANQETSVPELKRVIVVNGGDVAVTPTLAESIEESTGGTVPDDPGTPGEPPTGTTDEQIANLLSQAVEHFDAAQQALTEGDLATYQEELTIAQSLVEQANRLAADAAGLPSPTPTPSPSASPSPSA
jgi:uncharacterized protein